MVCRTLGQNVSERMIKDTGVNGNGSECNTSLSKVEMALASFFDN